MSQIEISKFNTLPRPNKLCSLSKNPRNEWYFDIRYIHFEPNPSHFLVVVQPQSGFVHLEKLPLGTSMDVPGYGWFPETADECAPEVAKALIRVFTTTLDIADSASVDSSDATTTAEPFAPGVLYTMHKSTADAVSKQLKSLGVRQELTTVKLALFQVNFEVKNAFGKYFYALVQSLGVPKKVVRTMIPMEGIGWQHEDRRLDFAPREDFENQIAECATKVLNCRPRAVPPSSGTQENWNKQMLKDVRTIGVNVESKSNEQVEQEAKDGDPYSMLDFALRLLCGIKCFINRPLARSYLIQVVLSEAAPDILKATAHALLHEWYIQTFTESIPMRYLLSACHHARMSVLLARKISPPGADMTPSTLFFAARVFQTFVKEKPELLYWYKELQEEVDRRNKEIERENKKMEVKRMKNPLRYKCANPGCGIAVDKGKLLPRCSGKCDPDVKPSYCSAECQKADWKNHKPFCKPGAPCSVIDTSEGDSALPSSTVRPAPSPSSSGTYQVGVNLPNGGGSLNFSSSTLTPQELKDVRDMIQNSGVEDIPEHMRNGRFEVFSVDD